MATHARRMTLERRAVAAIGAHSVLLAPTRGEARRVLWRGHNGPAEAGRRRELQVRAGDGQRLALHVYDRLARPKLEDEGPGAGAQQMLLIHLQARPPEGRHCGSSGAALR